MAMRKLILSVVLAGFTASATGQTQQDLARDGAGGSTDNVLTYGMGYHQNRYSTLKQINKTNIKRLVPVWSTSLSSNYGEQGQPLVYNDVMFVANAEYTIAIDVATGKQMWRTAVEFDPNTPRVVC
jgi:alcohol dehydrogenase (cytochrome c)